jgi:hypothetical protein
MTVVKLGFTSSTCDADGIEQNLRHPNGKHFGLILSHGWTGGRPRCPICGEGNDLPLE